MFEVSLRLSKEENKRFEMEKKSVGTSPKWGVPKKDSWNKTRMAYHHSTFL